MSLRQIYREYPTFQNTTKDLSQKIVQKLALADCVGPNSSNFETRFVASVEEPINDEEIPEQIIFNEQGCKGSQNVVKPFCAIEKVNKLDKLPNSIETCAGTICSIVGAPTAECSQYSVCGGSNGDQGCVASVTSSEKCKTFSSLIPGNWIWNLTRNECAASIVKGACNDKKVSNRCSSTGFCDDFEYGRSSLCIKLGSNWNTDCSNRTKTGQCIVPPNECSTVGQTQYSMVSRALTEKECLRKGSYCQMSNYVIPGLNSLECIANGGAPLSSYKWTANNWLPGQLSTAAWYTPSYSYQNQWGDYLSKKHLYFALNENAVKSIATEIKNLHQKTYSAYLEIFKALECDCSLESQSSCWPVTAKVEDGISERNIVIFSGAKFFGIKVREDLPLTAKATFHSVANFISNNSTSVVGVPVLSKRCNPIEVYNTVFDSNGNLVGQMIGDGYSFDLNYPVLSSFELCLEIDANIKLRLSTYSTYGIAIGNIYGSKLTSLDTSAFLNGGSVCSVIQGISGSISDYVFLPTFQA